MSYFSYPILPTNPVAFNPLRESKENLFASNLLPLPPKFAFQERVGRINWRSLMNTDLEKIQKEIDLKQLENLLSNITFAQLERDDIDRMGDSHFIKLFRLSQYSIEYLLYSQNYLESLCKQLDVEYKQNYERTQKVEEAVKKYQTELKLMHKELKLKQKTLSTYEYLMKLPAEQEQDVIKCKRCPKFFLSKQYLQKHYQRQHPEIDFYKEYAQSDLNSFKDQSLNDRQPIVQQQPQINQEQLFDKIKTELFTSLTQNFRKLEEDLHQLKEKQNFKQIQDMLQNYEVKTEEEQKKMQEQLSKPAKMLDELKGKWSEMFSQQSSTMKDLIQQSVSEAISKRKEERDKKKNNRSGDLSNESIQDQKVKYFEQRINEFEQNFKENEKIKQNLEFKLKEYEKKIQEKEAQEELLAKKLQEEEQKRKEEEKLRLEKEEEYQQQLVKQKELLKLQQQLQEEKKAKEELEKKTKEEQDKVRVKEALMIKQKDEEEKQVKAKKEQEQKKKQLELEQLERERKSKEEEDKRRTEQQKEKEDADQAKRKKEEEDAAAAAASAKLKKEEQERLLKEEEEKKKKKLVDEVKQSLPEEIVIEEEVEEEIEDIDEELKLKAQQQNQAAANKDQVDKAKIKLIVKKEMESDNLYQSNKASIKSIFPHNTQEVESKVADIKKIAFNGQNAILQQEFQSQKIQPSNQRSNLPQTPSRKAELNQVNDAVKSLNKKDVEKINNSLQKRLSDQNYAQYNGLIDNFLQRFLK